jgi:hypothetical protein
MPPNLITSTLYLAREIIEGKDNVANIEMSLTVKDCLEKPIIKTVFKQHPEVGFGVIKVLVQRFLDSFGFATKMNKTQIDMLSVDVIENFRYESLEDVILFFKLARQGMFGTTSRGVDSNLIFGDWFPLYLELKSCQREEKHAFEKDKLSESTLSIEDVKKSYQILTLSTEIENRINEITKDFDRAMLEDLIVDWQKSPEKYPYLKYLKKKRKEIK